MTLSERFWRKVDRRGEGECWPWMGAKNPAGYGKISVNGKTVDAHRVAYELGVGPIPAGMTIDHLCRNTSCVNPHPEHLEVVTLRENVSRGTSPTANNSRKTHCRKGHLLGGDNLILNQRGWRRCRECNVAWQRARYRREHPLRKRLPFAERLAQIVALKAEGLTHRQAADRLGVSRSLIGNTLYLAKASRR